MFKFNLQNKQMNNNFLSKKFLLSFVFVSLLILTTFGTLFSFGILSNERNITNDIEQVQALQTGTVTSSPTYKTITTKTFFTTNYPTAKQTTSVSSSKTQILDEKIGGLEYRNTYIITTSTTKSYSSWRLTSGPNFGIRTYSCTETTTVRTTTTKTNSVAVTYRITYKNYNSSGGGSVSHDIQGGKYASSYAPSIAARTGYNGTWSPSLSLVTQNQTYNVTWTKITYNINYYANGGVGQTVKTTKEYNGTYMIYYNTHWILNSTNFSYAGREFLGWATYSGASTPSTIYAPGKNISVTQNLNLYAVWKIKTYNITFKYHINGDTELNRSGNLPKILTAGTTVLSYAPTLSTYTGFLGQEWSFVKWTSGFGGGGITLNSSYKATEDITFYAQYEEIFTLTLNNYYKNGSSYSISKTKGTTIFLPTPPEREEQNFVKWTTRENGWGTAYQAGQSFTINGKTNLYAQWEDKPSKTITLSVEIINQTQDFYSIMLWKLDNKSHGYFNVNGKTYYDGDELKIVEGINYNISYYISGNSTTSLTDKMTYKFATLNGGTSQSVLMSYDTAPDSLIARVTEERAAVFIADWQDGVETTDDILSNAIFVLIGKNISASYLPTGGKGDANHDLFWIRGSIVNYNIAIPNNILTLNGKEPAVKGESSFTFSKGVHALIRICRGKLRTVTFEYFKADLETPLNTSVSFFYNNTLESEIVSVKNDEEPFMHWAIYSGTNNGATYPSKTLTIPNCKLEDKTTIYAVHKVSEDIYVVFNYANQTIFTEKDNTLNFFVGSTSLGNVRSISASLKKGTTLGNTTVGNIKGSVNLSVDLNVLLFPTKYVASYWKDLYGNIYTGTTIIDGNYPKDNPLQLTSVLKRGEAEEYKRIYLHQYEQGKSGTTDSIEPYNSGNGYLETGKLPTFEPASGFFAGWEFNGTLYTDSNGNIIKDVAGIENLYFSIKTLQDGTKYTLSLSNYSVEIVPNSDGFMLVQQSKELSLTLRVSGTDKYFESVYGNDLSTMPPPPERTDIISGYQTFLGYYNNGIKIELSDVDALLSASKYEAGFLGLGAGNYINLTCRWQDTATAELEEVRIDFYNENKKVITSGIVNINQPLSTVSCGIPEIKVDSGYVFLGWQTKNFLGAFVGQFWDANTIVTSALAGGSSVSLHPVIKSENNATNDLFIITTKNKDGSTFGEYKVTKGLTDYTFAPLNNTTFSGWYLGETRYTDSLGKSVGIPIYENLTLTAKYISGVNKVNWQINVPENLSGKVNLSKTQDQISNETEKVYIPQVLDANGLTITKDIMVDVNGVITANSSNAVAKFKGWSADASATEGDIEGSYINKDNLKENYYAIWQLIEQKVSFSATFNGLEKLNSFVFNEIIKVNGTSLLNSDEKGYFGQTITFRLRSSNVNFWVTSVYFNGKVITPVDGQYTITIKSANYVDIYLDGTAFSINVLSDSGISSAYFQSNHHSSRNFAYEGDEITGYITYKNGYGLKNVTGVYNGVTSTSFNYTIVDRYTIKFTMLYSANLKINIESEISLIKVGVADISGGTIIPTEYVSRNNDGSYNITIGQSITYNFIPNFGYGLKSNTINVKTDLTGDITSVSNKMNLNTFSQKFTFYENVTLYAEFKPILILSLELVSGNKIIENGVGSTELIIADEIASFSNGNSFSVVSGEKVEFIINNLQVIQGSSKYNLSKFQFIKSDGNLKNEVEITQAPSTVNFNMSENLKAKVLFEVAQENVFINLFVGTNGSVIVNEISYVSGNYNIEVAKKSDVRLLICPNNNYSISVLTIDGVSRVNDSNILFEKIDLAKTIVAEFELNPEYHSIELMPMENGKVIPSATYAKSGEIITLTIEPNKGYQLKDNTLKVLSNNVEQTITSYTFVMPNYLCQVYAQFEIVNYIINVENGLNGQLNALVSDKTTSTAQYGNLVKINVEANRDFNFKVGTLKYINLTTNQEVIIENNQFFMPDSNIRLTAQFTDIIYTISVDSNITNGKVTVSADNSKYGDTIVVSVVPNLGYKLKNYSLKYSGTIGNEEGTASEFITVSISDYNFKMPRGNVIVTAIFEIYFCDVTINTMGNGNVNPSTTQSVQAGQNLSITITPDANNYISSILVDGQEKVSTYLPSLSSRNNQYTLTLNSIYQNTSILIKFSVYPKITANIIFDDAEGVASMNDLGETLVAYNSNKNYAVSLLSDKYRVKKLIVNGEDVFDATTYLFESVVSDQTITAVIEKRIYVIASSITTLEYLNEQEGGIITPLGETEKVYKENLTYQIEPATGYYLKALIVDEERIDAQSSYTFSEISANHTIVAEFDLLSYEITAQENKNGVLTPNSQVVKHSKTASVNIKANEFYVIKSILVNGEIAIDNLNEINYTFNLLNVVNDSVISVIFNTIKTAINPVDNIYKINTVAELLWVEQEINNGNLLTAHFELANNIPADTTKDISTINFIPMGNVLANAFNGIFDGKGYYINGLNIIKIDGIDVYGLFGYVGANAEIKEINIKNCNINIESQTASYIGVLIGYNLGNITECYNNGNIIATINNANAFVGGIAGYNKGIIQKCYNNSELNITAKNCFVGGITGYNNNENAKVLNCYNKSNVTSISTNNTQAFAGGIVGYQENGEIHTCYNTGYLSSNFSSGVSGIAKDYYNDNTSKIFDCYYLQGVISLAQQDNCVGTILLDTEMKNSNSFVNFDFNSVWIMDNSNNNINKGYPVLRNVGNRIISTSINNGEYGEISPLGEKVVEIGNDFNVAINIFSGKEITKIEVNGIELNNSQLEIVANELNYIFENVFEKNQTIKVFFEREVYTINAQVDGTNGTISPVGNQNAYYGDNLVYSITPDEHYHLEKIFIDDEEIKFNLINNEFVLENISQSHNLKFVFAIDKFKINIKSGSNGKIDLVVDGENVSVVNSTMEFEFDYGSNVDLTITPNKDLEAVPAIKYYIYEIKIDGNVYSNYNKDGFTYSFTNLSGNRNIEVYFRIYTITVNASCQKIDNADVGTISPAGLSTVNFGSDVTYLITPNEGYHIKDIIIDGEPISSEVLSKISSTYTLKNLIKNHTILVVFAINDYKITVINSNKVVKVYPSDDVIYVQNGESKMFTFEAPLGTRINQIKIDGVILNQTQLSNALENGYMFNNISSNHTLEVIGEVIKFEVTAGIDTSNPRSNGTISPSGLSYVNYGFTQTYNFSASENSFIKSIIVDGIALEGETLASAIQTGLYSFNNVMENHTITVVYHSSKLFVNVVTDGHATLSVNEEVLLTNKIEVNYNDSITFKISPQLGYHLSNIFVNNQAISTSALNLAVQNNEYVLQNILEDSTISFVFETSKFNVVFKAQANGNIRIYNELLNDSENYANNELLNVLNYGDSISAQAKANTGYKFLGWSDGENIVCTDAIILVENVMTHQEYTAMFEIDQVVLNIQFNNGGYVYHNGTLVESGEILVDYFTNHNFTFTPLSGYDFETVFKDEQAYDLEYAKRFGVSFANVSANHSLTINFSAKDFIISTTVGENGTVRVDGAEIGTNIAVKYGSKVAFSITPNNGYLLNEIKVNGILINETELILAKQNNEFVLNTSTMIFEDENSISFTFIIKNMKIYVSYNNLGSVRLINAQASKLDFDDSSKTYSFVLEIPFGGTQQFEISADGLQYQISKIYENGIEKEITNKSIMIYTMQNVMETMLLNVEFTLRDYNISLTQNTEFGGTISGAGGYKDGDTVNLSATTNDNYQFVGWYENNMLISDNSNYSFEAKLDRNFEAVYKVLVQVGAEGNGKVTINNEDNLTSYYALPNEQIIITAISTNQFYKFSTWKNGIGTNAQTTITIGLERAYYEALFIQKSATINVIIGEGGINVSTVLSATYYNGNVELNIANSNSDMYNFVGWSTDIGEGSFTTLTELVSSYLIADADVIGEKVINIYAKFSINAHTITLSSTHNRGTGGYAIFADGTTIKQVNNLNLPLVIYEIQPETHTFVNWTFSDASLVSYVGNLTDITLQITSVTGDVIIYANFEVITFDITIGLPKVNANGNISLLQNIEGSAVENDTYNLIKYTFDYGTDVSVRFTPDAGYSLNKIIINGEELNYSAFAQYINADVFTFKNIFTNNTFTFIFGGEYFNLTMVSNIEYAGYLEGEGRFEAGSEANVLATAIEGYEFFAWRIDGIDVSNNSNYSFIINKNTEIMAVFKVLVQLVCDAENGNVAITQTGTSQGYFLPNEEIEIVATTTNNFVKFKNWTNINSTNSTDILTITNEPLSLTAEFVSKIATLIVVYKEGAVNSESYEEYQVLKGLTIDLSTDVKSHYYNFLGWKIYQGEGAFVDANALNTTFTISDQMIIDEAEVIIYADFELRKFNITIENINDFTVQNALGETLEGKLQFENGTLTMDITLEDLDKPLLYFINSESHNLINISTDNNCNYYSLEDNIFAIGYIDDNVKITAEFNLKTFEIYYEFNEYGNVEMISSQTVKYGETVSFSIESMQRYALNKIYLNEVELSSFELINGVYSYEYVTQNCSFNFVFDYAQMHLTFISNAENACVFVGEGYYDQNELVTVSLTANDGYEYQTMKVNGTLTSSTRFSFIITDDTVIELIFKVRISVASDGNGNSIIGTQGNLQQVYALPGSTLTLSATANTGYQFAKWNGNGTYTSAVANITVPNVKTIFTAEFESKLVSVNIIAGNNGSVLGSSQNANNYKIGDVLVLVANGNSGYNFDSWTGTVSGVLYRSNSNTTYTITDLDAERGEIILTANYSTKSFAIIISTIGDGSISPSGTTYVDFGESVVLTINPNSNRVLKSLLINGIESKNLIINNTLTLNNISENKTIKGEFDYLYWINFAEEFEGNGTEENPYLITNENEFAYVALAINNGYRANNGKIDYYQAYYLVTRNMNFEGKIWTPIGLNEVDLWFDGTLNVNYKQLKNIDYDKAFTQVLYNGLIGTLGPNGRVINLSYGDIGIVAIIIAGSVVLICGIIILIIMIKRRKRTKVNTTFVSSISSSKKEKTKDKPFNLDDFLKRK